MRLVVWNCCEHLGRKAGSLLSLAPDVAVVPECEREPVWPLDVGMAGPPAQLWQGRYDFKGLGVLAFTSEWSIALHATGPRVPWVLPVEVSGPRPFLLLALWTVQGDGRPNYAGQVAAAIDAYEDEIASRDVVLAGDFNCSPQTHDNRAHLANVARLESLGLASAYHACHGREPGEEEPGTLFWQWKQDAPFHCDLCFVPSSWLPDLRSVQVGSYEDWVAARLSDHVPVVVEVGDPS